MDKVTPLTEKSPEPAPLVLSRHDELLSSPANDAKPGLLADFWSSMKVSAVQPIEGTAQLVDRYAGTSLQKSVAQEAPKQAEFLSSNWVAQQAGAAAGMLPWFLALHTAGSKALRYSGLAPNASLKMLENGEAMSLKQSLSARSYLALETGLAGFALGGLSPVDSKDPNYWGAKLKHASSYGMTFATMSAAMQGSQMAGQGFEKFANTAATDGVSKKLASMGGAILQDNGAAGFLAGIPAGFVSANSESLLNGKGLAKGEDQLKAMAGFSILGFGFGRLMPNEASRAGDNSGAKNDSAPVLRSDNLTATAPADLNLARITGNAGAAPEAAAHESPVNLSLSDLKSPEPVAVAADIGGSVPLLREAAKDNGSGAALESSAKEAAPKPEAKMETKTVLEDGSIVITKPNMTITKSPNGDVTLTNAEGSTINKADGWIIRLATDGTEISRTRPKGRTPLSEREFNVASMNVDPVARASGNLAQRPFVMDGVKFESVEAFYRYLQWSHDPAKQGEMPGLFGSEARAAGKGCKFEDATYRGQTFKLGSPEHHALIKEAIKESFVQNPEIGKQFADTYPRPIIHNTGRPESRNTKLPGVVFSRILTEVRQELVDANKAGTKSAEPPGAVKSGDTAGDAAGKVEAITKPDGSSMTTTTLTDALSQLRGDRDLLRYHPIDAYIDAMKGHDFQVKSFVGGGSDSLVFELNSGNLLKMGGRALTEDMGTRPFDLPILNRGSATLDGGFKMYFFEQAKGKPVSTTQMKQFQRSLPEGYYFTDAKPQNLVELNGAVKLSDYWAVTHLD